MKGFNYSLSKKGKSICPKCERKTFVLYIDNNTGNSLHSTVGKCDRADNCGHHYKPKEYFSNNNVSFGTKEYKQYQKPKPQPKLETSYIDSELLNKTQSHYKQNNFIQWLIGKIGDDEAKKVIDKYFIGTSKHWDNSTVFWQIDTQGRVRTGKIMQYDRTTGKRIKEPFNKIGWVHSVLKLDNFNLTQCFFGEHLLKDKNKIVAIVESEKSAIIASVYFPDFIWLACGGSEGLNIDKCRILKGRKIVLYPDVGQFDKWNKKAKDLQSFCNVSVSNLLEQNATEYERKNGFDLSDYLIKYPLSDFIPPQLKEVESTESELPNEKVKPELSEPERALKKMIQTNPTIQLLIDAFQLELIQ